MLLPLYTIVFVHVFMQHNDSKEIKSDSWALGTLPVGGEN